MNTIRKFILLPVALNLFDAVINKTTSATTGNNLSGEMKTFYSDYLIDMAEPLLVHDQFGQKHPIPKNGGKTIEFRKYDPLPKATTALTEGVTPEGQKLNMGVITATVAQYGGFIELSDMLLLSAIDNNLVQATKLLGSQAGRTLDTITREVLNGGTNVLYAPKVSGGSTTEVAVISLGGIVTSSSLRLAGNRLDEAIAVHLRDLLGIKIGERTAEVIKIKIGSILPFEDGRERDMIISGQDVLTEQPKEVTIQSEDVRDALQAPIDEMVVHIKETFKKTNPDLASDIISNGILLTGGGGLLAGLDRYLSQQLEIPVWTSETALTNVVSGCLKVLETPTALKQILMRSK